MKSICMRSYFHQLFHPCSSVFIRLHPVGFVWKLGRCPKSCCLSLFSSSNCYFMGIPWYPHFQAHANIISSWLHIPVNIQVNVHIAGLYPHFSNFRISHLHKLHHTYIDIYTHTYVYYIYMYVYKCIYKCIYIYISIPIGVG